MQTQPTHGLLVEFDLVPIQDEAKSTEAGRPIFEDKEYVRILVPGDKYSEVHRAIRPEDKRDFAQEYAFFKGKSAGGVVGTPLSTWPAVTSAQVKELEHFNLKTVEQLAAISDSNAQNIGPIQALRQKAKDFIAAAAGNAPMEKMRSELDKKDAELDAVRKQLREQGEAIEKLRKKG